jgi:hypothetical protein
MQRASRYAEPSAARWSKGQSPVATPLRAKPKKTGRMSKYKQEKQGKKLVNAALFY